MRTVTVEAVIAHLVNDYFPNELSEYGVRNDDGIVEQILARGFGFTDN